LTENYYFQELWNSDREILRNKESKFDLRLPWKNVSKLKHVKFESSDIMLLYEVWNQTAYQYTAYRVIDAYAGPLVNETRICYPIRLHRNEPIFLDEDGNVKILESKMGKVNIYTIEASRNPSREDDAGMSRAVGVLATVMVAMMYF
jgi:hypothetical protein